MSLFYLPGLTALGRELLATPTRLPFFGHSLLLREPLVWGSLLPGEKSEAALEKSLELPSSNWLQQEPVQ